MHTRRSLVRAELNKRIVPMIFERGFSGPDSISGNARAHIYRRITTSHTQDFSINFEKYGLARFTFGADILPGQYSTHEPGEIIDVPAASVHPRGILRAPYFNAERTIADRLRGVSDIDLATRAVTESISVFVELDEWWEAQTDTQYIRTMYLPYAVPKFA